jgi:hypothetical protein
VIDLSDLTEQERHALELLVRHQVQAVRLEWKPDVPMTESLYLKLFGKEVPKEG